MPLIAIIADELLTSPFATEIIRGLDNSARKADLSVFFTTIGGDRDIAKVHDDVSRFRPRAIGYAAMYHKEVALPPDKAYGADPRTGFPPNVAVVFEIKLISVK